VDFQRHPMLIHLLLPKARPTKAVFQPGHSPNGSPLGLVVKPSRCPSGSGRFYLGEQYTGEARRFGYAGTQLFMKSQRITDAVEVALLELLRLREQLHETNAE
jgi:hypothetical protein